MNIRTVPAKPVPQPPPTFSIEGLSREEFQFICILLARGYHHVATYTDSPEGEWWVMNEAKLD